MRILLFRQLCIALLWAAVCAVTSAHAQGNVATIAYPSNGTVGVDLTLPIQWTAADGAQTYYLYLGTALGAKDVVNSGETLATSYLVKSFPHGQTLYARLWTKITGQWRYVDSTFSAAPLNTATITYPRNGQVGVDLSVPIQWTSVVNVEAYSLYIGTTLGAKDLVDSGEKLSTSYLAAFLPASQTLYVRLWTKVGGIWRYKDSTFSAAKLLVATMTSPQDGQSGFDVAMPLQWTSVPDVQAYYLYIGTSPGARDLVDSGERLSTSYTASNLPSSQTLHVRLWTRAGGVWRYKDSTFSAAPLLVATLTYPRDGQAAVDVTVPLQWTSVGNVQAYYLYIGTAPGASDLVNSGETLSTSYLASSLPTNRTLYVRLLTRVGGVWRYKDSTFSAGRQTARIVAPVDGTMNADLSEPIRWTPVADVQTYYLYIGSSKGARDILESGETLQTSIWKPLPSGQQLFARLWTKSGGVWAYRDSTFSGAQSTARITSPSNGASGVDLAGAIEWNSIPGAQTYSLYLGSSVGAKDIVDSGELTITTFLPTNLPAGQTIYARLWTKVNNSWKYADSTFSGVLKTPRLIYPANGQEVLQLTESINWSSVTGADVYYLYVGTSQGSADLINSGEIATTSYSHRGNLPAGQVLFARVWAKAQGAWRYSDSTFSLSPLVARLTSPVDGSNTVLQPTVLSWNGVAGAQGYYVYIGTSAGQNDIVNSGLTQTTTYALPVLPAAQPLHVRLHTQVSGVWRYVDSTFTADYFTPEFIYPTNGSVGISLAVPFQWNSPSNAQAHRLYIGTAPGANDLLNSGELSSPAYAVPNSNWSGIIYATAWSKIGGAWLRYATVAFTRGSSVVPATITKPANGSLTFDAATPFEWTAVPLAEAYRLTIGTAVNGNQVHDSGEIVTTKRFVPNVPLGVPLFGQVFTKINGTWATSSFTFTALANGVRSAEQIDAALWATGVVREMAGADNRPYAGTILDLLTNTDQANCADFTTTLLEVASDLNLQASIRRLSLAFNTGDPHPDEHVLAEVFDSQSGSWILLDPTFGLTVKKSNGSFATAQEASAATLASSWGAISYNFLTPAGDAYARTYYLDYPLLYLNVYPSGQYIVVGQGNSQLPYMETVALPVSGAWSKYAIRCSSSGATNILINGVLTNVSCKGVDNFSAIFLANTVSAASGQTMSFQVYRPRRFVF